MIIKNAVIALNCDHQFLKRSETSESLRSWKTPAQPRDSSALSNKNLLSDTLKVSPSAQALQADAQELDLDATPDAHDGAKVLIIKEMVRRLTGQTFKVFSVNDLKVPGDQVDIAQPPFTVSTAPPTAQQAPSVGFGLVYEKKQVYQESESSHFSAQGTFETQDGQSIAFAVDLKMSREFTKVSSLTITAGDPERKVDPLVINFAGNAADLSAQRFAFDIDANGTTEQIAMLKSGSGYLALDKNGDGTINNGSELFGPHSGNGFAELAQYDSDKNGFIDEADPIYDRLRIWQRHEDGSQQLLALGDKQIGAIYLGHATTPFQLKTSENNSLGEVTDSGVYIKADGSVGTIQQLNLSV